MKRKIINIDEELCDGCGNCVTGCSEGALQILDGVAKLVKEDFCDGFGDCIGACPTGALSMAEREAAPFNVEAVKEYLQQTQGQEAVWRMEEALNRHDIKEDITDIPFVCPGAQMREINRIPTSEADSPQRSQEMPSGLGQWPVQLHLVPPKTHFFENKELVVMNTCGPLASPNIHDRYLKGRSVVVGCPKLDDTTNYAAKLGSILKENKIPKVIVARMEVPCCRGLLMITENAVALSGRDDLVLEEHVIGIDGHICILENVGR